MHMFSPSRFVQLFSTTACSDSYSQAHPSLIRRGSAKSTFAQCQAQGRRAAGTKVEDKLMMDAPVYLEADYCESCSDSGQGVGK